ncbi:hypothetical protein DMA11_10450 [Marinilabiliaceae bacterium JC017]|nr:hypothetical protein DMA11_10450 [Marinilabiliaceae bacterium JC017]
MKTELVTFYKYMLPCVKLDNVVWVAIKPICDAIGLDSDWQMKSISEDKILGAERAEHTVQVPNFDTKNRAEQGENINFNQGRKMICLPLEFIHGWLFQVKITNTMKEETELNLIRFKRECYRVLFKHFFGNMRKQIESNTTEIKLLEEINQLNENQDEIKATLKEKKKQLDAVRKERLNNYPTLF